MSNKKRNMDFKVKITNVVVITASIGCGERGLITKGYFNTRFSGKNINKCNYMDIVL